MTDPISSALRLAYAASGPARLLPAHLGQSLSIQGVGRFHNALGMKMRPHFEDGGSPGGSEGSGNEGSGSDSSGNDSSNSGNYGGGSNYGGYSGGTGGFGFGGVGSSEGTGFSSSTSSSKSSGSSEGDSSPAGSSTGGYGGFGGFSSSSSVGGSYSGGSGSSNSDSSNDNNGGFGSLGGLGGFASSNSRDSNSSGGFGSGNGGSYGSGTSGSQATSGFSKSSASSSDSDSNSDSTSTGDRSGFGQQGSAGFGSDPVGTSVGTSGASGLVGGFGQPSEKTGFGSFGGNYGDTTVGRAMATAQGLANAQNTGIGMNGAYDSTRGSYNSMGFSNQAASDGIADAADTYGNDMAGWSGDYVSHLSPVTSTVGGFTGIGGSSADQDSPTTGYALGSLGGVNPSTMSAPVGEAAQAGGVMNDYGGWERVASTNYGMSNVDSDGYDATGNTVDPRSVGTTSVGSQQVAGLGALSGSSGTLGSGLEGGAGPSDSAFGSLAGSQFGDTGDPAQVGGEPALTVHALPTIGTVAGPTSIGNVGTAPGNIGAMGATFAAAEEAKGLPSGYLGRTAAIESRGNPDATNPSSGAAGEFQFTRGTAQQYGLADPSDPMASTQAAAHLAADNAAAMKSFLGRDPTGGELYAAHQQGIGGVQSLMSHPDQPAASLVGLSAVTQNGGTPDMSARDFLGKIEGLYNNAPVAAPREPVANNFTTNGVMSDAQLAAYTNAQADYKNYVSPPGLQTAMAGLKASGEQFGTRAPDDYKAMADIRSQPEGALPGLARTGVTASYGSPAAGTSSFAPTSEADRAALSNASKVGGLGALGGASLTGLGAGFDAPSVDAAGPVSYNPGSAAAPTQAASDLGFSNPSLATGAAMAAVQAAGVGDVGGFLNAIATSPTYSDVKADLADPNVSPTKLASDLANAMGNTQAVADALAASGAALDTASFAQRIAANVAAASAPTNSQAPGNLVSTMGLDAPATPSGVPGFTFNGNTFGPAAAAPAQTAPDAGPPGTAPSITVHPAADPNALNRAYDPSLYASAKSYPSDTTGTKIGAGLVNAGVGLVPGVGLVNGLSSLLGGPNIGDLLAHNTTPAGIDDPAMAHAMGNNSSSNGFVAPYSPRASSSLGPPPVAPAAAPANGNLDPFTLAQQAYQAAIAGMQPTSTGAYAVPNPVPLTMPTSVPAVVFDPWSDPAVQAALAASRRA